MLVQVATSRRECAAFRLHPAIRKNQKQIEKFKYLLSVPMHMDTEYERIDITLPTGLLKDFRAFCKTQGMKPSPRIAVLIEKDLEDYYYEQVDKAIFAVRSKAVRPPSAKGNPPKPR